MPQHRGREPRVGGGLGAARLRRRRPGRLRGRRGGAARRGRASAAARHRARQPVPRPARPLRRARGDRRPVAADDGRAAGGLAARAKRRRPARGLARERGRDAHIRHRRRRLGPTGDAARERLEVVPGLRDAAALRAGLPRPPGRLELPRLRPAAAAPRRLGRHARSARPRRHPVRAANAARGRRRRAAHAGPLQRLQRARRGGGRVRRRRRRRRPHRARAWSGSTPPSGGSSGSASAIATPCCSWPRTRPARTS